jgi:hypothetical protein
MLNMAITAIITPRGFPVVMVNPIQRHKCLKRSTPRGFFVFVPTKDPVKDY